VAGDRADVEYVIRTLQAREYGFHVVGVALFGTDRTPVVVGDRRYPVRGSVERVADIASRIGADTIVVASRPENDSSFVRELSWQLEGTAANLVLSNQLTDVVGPRISFRPVEGLPMLQIRIPSYEGGYYLLKRGLDISVAALALACIGVITPLLALVIKLDSPGPVFFAQQRVGRDGRLFTMYKFRTMVVDAEQRLTELQQQNEGAGLLFKMRQDPRVTRVGAVLRKLSIDELPQFWNVLRGEMSVVGPRPPLPDEVTAYDGRIVRRLYVKPGITGPWQVSGRSDLSWDESVRLDLSYVENWSLMSDLQIMWRTARVMVQREGAY
jgi:exopolysaccharide biosynthesis polyprenyl glycosylphosphotransferase